MGDGIIVENRRRKMNSEDSWLVGTVEESWVYWSTLLKSLIDLLADDKSLIAANADHENQNLPVHWIEQAFQKRECAQFVPSEKDANKCGCGRLYSAHNNSTFARLFIGNPLTERWAISKHTRVETTDAFGTIEFQGGPHPHKAQYVRLGYDSDPEQIMKLFTDIWGIEPPKLVISVHGGIANFSLQPKLARMFKKGLLKAAKTTGAWIITSGINAGCVRHVAAALGDSGTTRSQSKIVTIGIAPWGLLKKQEDFVGRDITISYHAQSFSPKGRFAVLNDKHSYFLLVDNGTIGRYGADIILRKRLEEYISKQTIEAARKNAQKERVPVVCVVLEGGACTIRSVLDYVTNVPPVPVVVCDGSGRAADLLAFAHQSVQDDGSLPQAVKPQLSSLVQNIFGYDKRQAEKTIIEMELCIKKKHLITVFRLGEDLQQDVDHAILTALLKGLNLQASDQLSLALAWNRVDIAQSDIFILGQEWPKGCLEMAMMEALICDRVDFVKLLLENGVSMEKFLTIERLEELYNTNKGPANTLAYVVRDVVKMGTAYQYNLPDLGLAIEKLMGSAYTSTYRSSDFLTKYQKRKQTQELFMRKKLHTKAKSTLFLSKKRDYESLPQEIVNPDFGYPFNELLVWAVLMKRQEMARLMWCHGEEALPKSLVACKLYKSLAKEAADDYLEVEICDELKRYAEEYRKLAVELLEHCYQADDDMTFLLLTYELNNWGKQTCLSLAVMANHKEFLAHPSCQILLADLWHGGLQIRRNSNLKVLAGLLCPPYILCLDFKTKEELLLQPQTAEEHAEDMKDDDSDSSSGSSDEEGNGGRRHSDSTNSDVESGVRQHKKSTASQPSQKIKLNQKLSKVQPMKPMLIQRHWSTSDQKLDSTSGTPAADVTSPPVNHPLRAISVWEKPARPKFLTHARSNSSLTRDSATTGCQPRQGSSHELRQKKASRLDGGTGKIQRRASSVGSAKTQFADMGNRSELHGKGPAAHLQTFIQRNKESHTGGHLVHLQQPNKYRSLPVRRKFYEFYVAPITTFWFSSLSYLLFLLCFTYTVLVRTPKTPAWPEIIVIANVVSLGIDMMRKLFLSEPQGFIQKLGIFCQYHWNWTTLLGVLMFILGFCLRMSPEKDIMDWGRVLYCCNISFWYLRLFDILSVNSKLGPYITMVGKMVTQMYHIVTILTIVLMAFGILRQSILFPNEDWQWILVRNIFYKPYFMLYGEVYAGEIDTCGDLGTGCVPGGWITVALMAAFLLVANILLISLLIAVFNNIYTDMSAVAHLLWKFQRYQQVMEYEAMPFLPPPMILLCDIYLVLKYCLWKPSGGKKRWTFDYSLKLFLEDDDVEKIHDFEEECMDDLAKKKEFDHLASAEDRIRRTADRSEFILMKLNDMSLMEKSAKSRMATLEESIGTINRNVNMMLERQQKVLDMFTHLSHLISTTHAPVETAHSPCDGQRHHHMDTSQPVFNLMHASEGTKHHRNHGPKHRWRQVRGGVRRRSLQHVPIGELDKSQTGASASSATNSSASNGPSFTTSRTISITPNLPRYPRNEEYTSITDNIAKQLLSISESPELPHDNHNDISVPQISLAVPDEPGSAEMNKTKLGTHNSDMRTDGNLEGVLKRAKPSFIVKQNALLREFEETSSRIQLGLNEGRTGRKYSPSVSFQSDEDLKEMGLGDLDIQSYLECLEKCQKSSSSSIDSLSSGKLEDEEFQQINDCLEQQQKPGSQERPRTTTKRITFFVSEDDDVR